MANKEHLEILEKGRIAWNNWRKDNQIKKADLSRLKTPGIDLLKANLSNTNLYGADLSGANLSKADLSGANLSKTKFSRANLSEANLKGTLLFDAKLLGVNLVKANLPEVMLKGQNLSYANLYGANLSGTNFYEANFFATNLSNANLSGANLYGANLSNANLSGANLYGTNLSKCFLNKTIFSLTSLRTCIGLEDVTVGGNCSIDFKTLKDSWPLPKEFLVKIGLPQNYLNYLPDFFHDSGMNLFPVFLSHSGTNKDFARKLYDALIKRGVQVWYDEKKMKPGDDILDSIDKGINVYDKMILVCSKESLNSWWVEEELDRIFEKERKYRNEKGKKHRLLIPVTIDNTLFESNESRSKSIRKRIVGDFKEWDNEEKFDVSLNQLIESLDVDRGEEKVISFL